MTRYPVLDHIVSLDDFRMLSDEQLPQLADEIRSYMINVILKNGGHLASSLGAVELIIALHRVFHVPEDKIIFDVGHQAYAHKILTGRKECFSTIRRTGGISGFPKVQEHVADCFNTGHASTSISAALGFARARALKGTNEAVIALIGDGALTGGLAFEALNDAGQSKQPLIVLLNDNDMSISKNVGALNRYLSEMRASTRYQRLKRRTISVLDNNRLGKWMSRRMERLKNRIKYFLLPNVVFEGMGFTYLGPIDGHDISALIRVFEKARAMQRPVIIHAITKKGKGYLPAQTEPEKFHGISPVIQSTDEETKAFGLSNSDVFGKKLLSIAQTVPELVAITAAMPSGTGLLPFSKAYPDRFFDVGIAEGHAVTMAAGLAAAGCIPVVAVYSTFLQRAYDMILHDVCLQKLPVIFAIDRSGLVGEDGETHQGIYDIAYLSTLPNFTIYSPASQQELMHMLEYAISKREPCAIRYPKKPLMQMVSDQPIEKGKWETIVPVRDYTILATGSMVELALPVCRKYDAGLVNVRTIKPMDEELLCMLERQTKGLLVIEEGIHSGGLGSSIASRFSQSNLIVRCMGIPDEPVPQGSVQQQLEWCGLTAEQIISNLLALRGK